MGVIYPFIFLIGLIAIIYGGIIWFKNHRQNKSVRKQQIIVLVGSVLAIVSIALYSQTPDFKQYDADSAKESSSKSVSKKKDEKSKSISKSSLALSKSTSRQEKESSKSEKSASISKSKATEQSKKSSIKSSKRAAKKESKLEAATSKSSVKKESPTTKSMAKPNKQKSSEKTSTNSKDTQVTKAINDSLAEDLNFFKKGNNSYSYAQFVENVSYSNEQATVQVSSLFVSLSEQEKSEVASRTKGMIEGTLLTNDDNADKIVSSGTGLYQSFKYGQRREGHALLSDHREFKWY